MSNTAPVEYIGPEELQRIRTNLMLTPLERRLAEVLVYERGVTKDRADAEATLESEREGNPGNMVDLLAELTREQKAHTNTAAVLVTEREMAAGVRTRVAHLEAIVKEKEDEADELRARKPGRCDHEVAIRFHVVGGTPLDGRIYWTALIPQAVPNGPERYVRTPMQEVGQVKVPKPPNEKACRYRDCDRELAGWSGRNQHERKAHGNLWSVGADEVDTGDQD